MIKEFKEKRRKAKEEREGKRKNPATVNGSDELAKKKAKKEVRRSESWYNLETVGLALFDVTQESFQAPSSVLTE